MKQQRLVNLRVLFLVLLIVLLIVSTSTLVFAADATIDADNTTDNNTTGNNTGSIINTTITANITGRNIITNITNITDITNITSITNIINISNSTIITNKNKTNDNVSTSENKIYSDFKLISIIPNKFKIGDIQFNIQIQNIGTIELKNLMAFVSGNGFSTYDVLNIESIKPKEKGYIIIMGNAKEYGTINLTIRINDKVFYNNITILNPGITIDNLQLQELKKKEELAQKELANLSAQMSELENNYRKLEQELQSKKNQYDVSNIKLDDLKKFLREAQAQVIQKDVQKAQVSISLASKEYIDQRFKLASATKISKTITSILKDNAVLISTIAGSIIAFFSLVELLKKKKEGLYQKIKEVKLTKDTRAVIEQKKKPKKQKGSKQPKKKKAEKKEETKDNSKTS